jgi:CRISPR-associated protein Csx16
MSTFFISRHPGAQQWAARQRLAVDHWVTHLNPAEVSADDTVIGTLPVNLAAEICARGARYVHLCLRLPAQARGQELSADELERLGAHLQGFDICRQQP